MPASVVYKIGDRYGNYEVTGRIGLIGKARAHKLEVKCIRCGTVLERYANKLNVDHLGCLPKSRCKNGHEMTGNNLYVIPGSKYTYCKACVRDNDVKWRYGGNREAVIQRDNECCVQCGLTRKEHYEEWGKDLAVDHINGVGVFDRKSPVPNNSMDALQTLCFKCHSKKTNKDRWERQHLASKETSL